MRQSEIIALVSVVCLGVGALGFGRYVASSVEHGLAERSREKLAVIGYSDVIVDVDGMVVALSGRVQTEKDREILIATLESTAKSTLGVGSVVDNLVVVSPLVEFAPTQLFIQKDDQGVTISGDAPNAAARDLLAARVEMSREGASFINLMKTQDTRASDAWLAAAEAAIDAVTALRVGQASVERSVVRVEGAAKDASSRDRIAARLQQQIDPTFALIMDISAPPPILSPYVFAVRKSETRGLEILRCAAPNENLRSVILGEMKSRGIKTSGDGVADELCQIANGAPNDAWTSAMTRAMSVLQPLFEGEVRIVDDRVSVDGFLEDMSRFEELRAATLRGWPPAYKVEVFLHNELPVVEPFTMTAIKQIRGSRLTGHTPNRERADAWAASFGAQNELKLARGAPVGFTAAVDVMLEALAGAPVGAATFEGANITFAAPGDAGARGLVEERLALALPPNFTLKVVEAIAPAASEVIESRRNAQLALDLNRYSFTARKDTEGFVELSGVVGDDRSQRVVRAYAGAKLGGDMRARLVVGEVDPPFGWERALFAGVEALSSLEAGELIAEPGAVYLRGSVLDETLLERVNAVLETKTPEEFTRFAEINVDQPLDPNAPQPAPPPLPARECVRQLNLIVSRSPIEFVVGKPMIDPLSYPVVQALAQTAARCPEARIEVGGHTDSVGSDDLNMALSARRAAAVRKSIVVGGVPAENVVARGYGEDAPIADNATAAGQAQNRRIEFRLIE